MKKFTYLSPLVLVCLCSAILSAQQLSPSIVWQKCLGGTGDDKANAIVRSADGGFVIAGSSKSNDGDVSGHHGATTTMDAWLAKLSATGTLQWQKSLGGTSDDEFIHLANTNDGGYITIGNTSSNDGDVIGRHSGDNDIWVVKFDRYGTIQWQKCLGGSVAQQAQSIHQTSDGGYIAIGNTNSNDGDVSGHHGTTSFMDAWVVKLDNLGTIQWQQCYGGSQHDYGHDIMEVSPGEYVMAIEGNSNDGNIPPRSGNSPFAYIVKIGATGQVIASASDGTRTQLFGVAKTASGSYDGIQSFWSCYPSNTTPTTSVHRYDSTSLSYIGGGFGLPTCRFADLVHTVGYQAKGPGSLLELNDNSVIFSGFTDDTASAVGNHGGVDGYIARGIASQILWKRPLGGTGNDYLQGITGIGDSAFVVAGYTNSTNGDVSGNHGGYDIWIVKLGNYNTIKGAVFMDYNSNGIKDSNEPFANSILVKSAKGSLTSTSSTYNGFFTNTADTGTFTTGIVAGLPYYSASPASRTSVFSSYNNTDSLQAFALQPIPGKRDYAVNLFPVSSVRPGHPVTYKLLYVNTGTDTLVNRTVKLIKDSRLQFTSATPAAGSISGDTISWTVTGLSPRDTGAISILLQVGLPPTVNTGDVLISVAGIDTTGDLNINNNTFISRQTAFGSYDPNDKQEAGGGSLSTTDVGNGKGLLYTIRFQNTGNDTAFTVIVKDTLDSKADSTTLEMVGASHPYRLTIQNGRYCTWTFNNILLPDSNRNEPASHGYISYRIRPKAGIAAGDSIKNNASIYFDFNLPVKTNTQVSKITQAVPAPDQPVVNGIISNYCRSIGAQKGKIMNVPGTSLAATVTVKLDNTTSLVVAADSTFTITPSTLSAGNHKVDITFSNVTGSKTLTINFSITAVSTPDVNVSANITTIINLTDNVVITAANASGGGATPKYTFAKDRLFATILQAEGSSATLTQAPASFAVGDNWIYVKMKTSDTCYTAQTNIDSIKIVRSSVTGITDIDFPQQVINIYPNPFSGQFMISGLNTGKTYQVTLYNMQGQQLLSQMVSNKQSLFVNNIITATGIYLLQLYDVKKQRLIGSVKLISSKPD